MRSYPALRTVAGIIKVVAVSCAIFALLGGVIAIDTAGFLASLGIWIGGVFSTLLSWAAAEMLLLFANMGEDIGRLVQVHERGEGLPGVETARRPAEDAPVGSLSGG